MKFSGTDTYIATEDLMVAVNAAITLERPLLIKGEPGTGKTILAHEVAGALGRPLIEWHIKSTTKAQQGLYEYDAVEFVRVGSAKLGGKGGGGRPDMAQAGGPDGAQADAALAAIEDALKEMAAA